MSMARATQRPQPWKRAPVTWTILVVTVLWYVAIEEAHGLSTQGLVQSGALDGYDVVHGQWWRLFTAMFVHMSPAHIAVNMISLVALSVVEMLIGRWSYLLTYLLSGFVGNLVMFLFYARSDVAGGASGAIFGIFGVALYLSIRGILTKSARNQLILMLILNLVYGFVRTDVGNGAHIGGLLTGAAMAAWMVYKPAIRASQGMKWAAWLIGLLTCIALVMAIPGNSPALG